MSLLIFINFLEGKIEAKQQKIFLIVDNLRVHKSKLVMEWVAAHKVRIEWFFLSPYSPELIPDEYINRVLKREDSSRVPAYLESFKQQTLVYLYV